MTRRQNPSRKWNRRPAPDNAHPLIKLVLTECDRRELSLREVERRAGVAESSISQWRAGVAPLVTNLEAVLGALGHTLMAVEAESTWHQSGRSGATPLRPWQC